MRTLLSFLFFVLIFTSCKKNNEKHSTGSILFEAEYINHAWAYQHTVTMIDSNGLVKAYNNNYDTSESWKFVDNLGYISKSDLLYNFSLCDSFVRNINNDTITQYKLLIPTVRADNLSAITSVGADMGQMSYYCYVWVESKQKYKRIFLATCGDWKQKNNDANAQTILNLIWK